MTKKRLLNGTECGETVLLYCLPFAFMAVNGDAVSGTMFFSCIDYSC